MALSNDAIALVAVNAFAAMCKIFLIACVGVCCAKFPKNSPLLPPHALQTLSRLSNILFLPALIIVSLGSSLSIAMLTRTSILILFCCLTNLVSFAVAYTLGYLLSEKDNEDLFTAASVAIGSPNAISFPLMLMQTLCEQPLVNADYKNDYALCAAEANSMLFVYSIGWHLMFWSYGFPMLRTLARPGEHADLELIPWIKQTLFSPSMLAIYVGLVVGLVPPLQNALFKDFTVLKPLGSALRILSEPVVCVNSLVMSANLAQIDVSTLTAALKRAQGFVSLDTNGWTHTTAGVVSPLHSEEAGVEVVKEVEQQKLQQPPAVAYALPQYRSIFSFLLCRLVIPPLVMLPVLRLAVDGNLVRPEDRMIQLIVVIEACAPSAQLIIVSLTQLGKPKAASQMAFLYVAQYLTCILTVTAWVSVAMSLVY